MDSPFALRTPSSSPDIASAAAKLNGQPQPSGAHPAPTQHAAFTFDSGDITISAIYQDQDITGNVSSSAVSLASPVWKKFIFPPWTQTRDNTEVGGFDRPDGSPGSIAAVKDIDFTEDDGDALLLLLRIAHLQFTKVPSKLTSAMVGNIAILCDKYDCVQLVHPWLSRWLEAGSYSFLQAKGAAGLFEAWVFGKEGDFTAIASSLVLDVQTANGEWNPVASGVSEVMAPLMPPFIMENILETRKAAVQDILAIPYRAVDRYSLHDNTRCGRGQKACDAIIYGSLIRGLGRLGLWPEVGSDDVDLSIRKLAADISALEVHILPSQPHHEVRFVPEHQACFSTDFKTACANVLKSIPNPVLDSHRRHMEIQRARLQEE